MQRPSSTLRPRRSAGRSTSSVWRVLLAAFVLATAISISPSGPGVLAATDAAPAAVEPDPLLVEISTISPSTLSDDNQPLTITGTVTNRSDEEWTTVRLYSFRSSTPILDATTLATSAATEADAYVGTRITAVGTEYTVDVLQPGQSAAFTLTVPRSEIAVVTPGVYWLGVHAFGDSSVPRDDFADGRARTFIPLVPSTRGKDQPSVDTAIVLPVRETVWFEPDGRIGNLARWSRTLSEGGRLDSILDAGETSSVPLTWLVDPAVFAAVRRLAVGNPPRSLAPDPSVEVPTEEPSDPPSDATEGAPAAPQPFAEYSDPIPPLDPDQELSESEQALAGVAQAWVDRFVTLTSGQVVLALPYGDLDVSAAAANGSESYKQAVARSNQVMAWLGVAATPALAPRDGILSPAAIANATPDSTILIGDTSFAQVPPDAPTSMVRMLKHKLVVTSTGAASGGPSPTPADDPLAIRQRLLSEAALRLSSPSPSPVVVMLPADWYPKEPGELLSNLDVPWLSPVSVAEIALLPAVSMRATDLAYIKEDEESELDVANFSAADQLTARADLLAGVLTLPNLLRQQVGDEVLASLSSGHRPHAEKAAASVQAATDFLDAQLASVTVEAPGAVTLSSQSGPFGANLVNGLDQPVTVRLGALSDGSLELEDQGVRQLSAGARFRILPKVTADLPGVHQVTLIITDVDGEPLGASTDLQVRAAQVSGLIWLLLGGGALLLFGTIGVRLFRRLRGRHTVPPEASAARASE